jgi:putative SOS response-associated peptidase YedK
MRIGEVAGRGEKGAIVCGRYCCSLEGNRLLEIFGLLVVPADFLPRYNIAPSTNVLTVREASTRAAEWLRWGLVPSWAKDPAIGNRMINARAETLLEKPSFRNAVQRRRCLILANGFYEWQRGSRASASVPYFFRLKDQRPFAFAGLWESWHDSSGHELRTCAIITCAPNALVANVHDRMPVILPPESCYEWIRPGPAEAVMSLLQPADPALMEAYRISRAVNSPDVDGPGVSQPAEWNQGEGS